jgi:flagellar motility protein MotE (MotC chaperone)
MKKLLSVIAWTLALNFLAAVGGIVWLYKSGKLDRDKVHQIKELVFAPATQPVEVQPEPRDPTTQPTLKLEEMLAKVSGRSASEQVEFMQKTFDAERMILDRRLEDLRNQRRTLEESKRQADKERERLVADQKKLAAAQQAQAKLVTDKGFQDTLSLYTTMPPRQVKTIFMTMSDETMVQYLRAMEPRTASKIMKEFKTADEEARIAKVMEKMREPQAAGNP